MKNEFDYEIVSFFENLKIEVKKSHRKRFLFFEDLINDLLLSIEEVRLNGKIEKYLTEEIKLVNQLWENSTSCKRLKLGGVLMGSFSSLFSTTLSKSLATIVKEIIDIVLELKSRFKKEE
jgi:hypothetical protein